MYLETVRRPVPKSERERETVRRERIREIVRRERIKQYKNDEEGSRTGDKIIRICRRKWLKMLSQLNSKWCSSINLNLDKYWNILGIFLFINCDYMSLQLTLGFLKQSNLIYWKIKFWSICDDMSSQIIFGKTDKIIAP